MAGLSMSRRFYYGMGGLSMIIPDLTMMQWVLLRYVPADGSPPLVAPAVFGFFMFLGRATEGFCNPLIGHWSDNCRHRWGRRLPFLRYGFAPYLLFFFLLFSPPAGPAWLSTLWAFVVLECYFFLYGAVFTPYLALLPELSHDLRERVDLMTIQSVFMMIGTFLFAAIGIVLELFGWRAMAAAATLVIGLFFLPTLFGIRERRRPAEELAPLPLAEAIRLTLRNRPFRYLVAATSCYWFGLSGVLALVPVWVKVSLGGAEGDVTRLMVPYLLMNLVFFFVFNALSRRCTKHVLLLATFAGSSVTVALLLLVGVVPFGTLFMQTAVIMTLVGAPVAGFMVLPYVVLADVVDYDARLTGRRREAVYFGVQGVFQKAAIGMSILAFTLVPYLGSADGMAVSVFGLKAMGLLCAAAFLLAAVIFLGYPIRERDGKAVVRGEE